LVRVGHIADDERVGAGARLRVAVDDDGVTDDRQGLGRVERVHPAAWDIEADHVGAGPRVGVQDRLPK
jgi:hypothetical protein